MVDYSILQNAADAWEAWGFEPWRHGALCGVHRRIDARKESMLGVIADYSAHDYVIWRHSGMEDAERVFRTWGPLPDVMSQRFVFISDESARGRVRSYWFGLRGFLEVHSHRFHGKPTRRIADLAVLIDRAWDLVRNGCRPTAVVDTGGEA